jgi:hypothetical protein
MTSGLRRLSARPVGAPLTTNNLRRRLPAVLDAAGIEGVTPHSFRRTVATVIDRAGGADLAAELAMAGITSDQTRTKRVRLEGVVARIVANRALDKLSNGRLGNVSPGLSVPGVEIDRLLSEGQRIFGWDDEDTGARYAAHPDPRQGGS